MWRAKCGPALSPKVISVSKRCYRKRGEKIRIPQFKAASILCAAALATIPTLSKAATFTPLGFLITSTSDPNYATRSSIPFSVSGDGTTVVGWSTANTDTHDGDTTTQEGFTWTSTGGMVGLGTFQGSVGTQTLDTQARGVNSDGTQVAGYGSINDPTLGPSTEAFRYANTTGGTFTVLADSGTPFQSSVANAISGDGNTVVGQHLDNNFNECAFFYRSSVGFQELLGYGLSTAFHSGNARGVNSDGSRIVGQEVYHGNNSVPVKEGATVATLWNVDSTGTGSTPIELPEFTNVGSVYESVANGISANGNAAVGYAVAPVGSTANVTQAVEWVIHGSGSSTTVDAPIGLGFIDGTSTTDVTTLNSMADAASADGSIVVGESRTDKHTSTSHDEAFIWFAGSNPEGGTGTMDDLYDYLTSLSPSLASTMSGWTLTEATGISSDGRTITGIGTHLADPTNPNSGTISEAFVVTIPEPVTLPLAGMALLLARCRRTALAS